MSSASANVLKARGSLLPAREKHRDALTAADAERHQTVIVSLTLHFGERLGGDRGARRADRVPERDRAAVRVDPGGIEVELLHHRQRLSAERLVELDHADVLELHAGTVQHL